MKKTAIIWNEIEEIRYTVLDGDYRMLHGIYVNDSHNEHYMEKELVGLIFNENLEFKVDFVTIEDFADAIRDGAYLIECGFLH